MQAWHKGQDKACGQEIINNPEFAINIPPRQPLESKRQESLSCPRGFGWEKDSRAEMAVPWASQQLRFRGDYYTS